MKKHIALLLSAVMMISLCPSVKAADEVTVKTLPTQAEITLAQRHEQGLDIYQDPTEGYYNVPVSFTVGETEINRSFVVYEPTTSYLKMPSVFIAAPAGEQYDTADDVAQWLNDTGWAQTAEDEQFRIACVFTEEDEWPSAPDAGDYNSETVYEDYRYLEAVRGVIRQRVFWNAGNASFYLVGYEGGADLMAYTAMYDPTHYAGLVTFGGKGASASTIDYCKNSCIVHDMDDSPSFPAEDKMRSELNARTWMFVTEEQMSSQQIQANIAYWKNANNAADTEMFSVKGMADEVYMEPAYRSLEMNENSVGALWITKVQDIDDCYDPDVPTMVYTNFLEKAWRFEAYPDCPLRAYEDLVENGEFTQEHIVVDGYNREYYVYCPENAEESLPVVVSFHGAGGTGREMIYRSGWYQVAKAANFIVVHPTGISAPTKSSASTTWNVNGPDSGVDDIKFFKEMLAQLKKDYNVDSSRVYVSGQSMGGIMSNGVALQAPELIAANASTSGALTVAQYNAMPNVNLELDVATMMSVGSNDKAETNMYGDNGSKGTMEQYWTERYGWSTSDAQTYTNGNFNYHVYEKDNVPIFQWILVDGKLHAPLPEEAYLLYDYMSKFSRGEDGSLLYMEADDDRVTYTVSTENTTGGTITVSKATAYYGDEITVSATPKSGYQLDKITAEALTAIEVTDGKFTMPARDVTVSATFTRISDGSGGSSSASSNYKLTFNTNGGSSITAVSKASGNTIDLSDYVPTKNGYNFVGWYSDNALTDKVTSVKLTRNTTVYAKWTKVDTATAENPFADVAKDNYYHDAVLWAVKEGITNGTSATTFSPDLSCTRAQMVTFLWRAAGSPAPAATSSPFTDVQPDAYYYNAVLWAVEQGITAGTSETTFSPDLIVTRGQTVTFLWRQAGSPAVSTSGSFSDVPATAYYANAVEWAVTEGVTVGTGNDQFSPASDCTRAQIVTLMYRNAQ